MKIKILIWICLFFSLQNFAQDSISWKKEFEIELKQEVIWTSDSYNNLYVAGKDILQKIDSKGIKLFEQSVKKYGQIAKIDARNPMKILIFSEQQQSVFYLDNTLSKQNNEIDLSNSEALGFELSYVTQVSGSNQLDKIWTYDQDNSKISLLTQNKSQSIQVENASGMLNWKQIYQFFEANDRLFVCDTTKGIFMFDLYGTFLQFFPEEDFMWCEVNENYMYLLKSDYLEIINLSSFEKRKITLPLSDAKRFTVNQNTVFIQTSEKLIKFSLDFF